VLESLLEVEVADIGQTFTPGSADGEVVPRSVPIGLTVSVTQRPDDGAKLAVAVWRGGKDGRMRFEVLPRDNQAVLDVACRTQ
jgi:hypothetical protein